MSVTKAQAGTYVQIAHKLRIQGRKDLNGPTVGAGLKGATEETNFRPRHEKTGQYQDETEPTLIDLREGDQVDVESLIAAGGLRPYTPPKAKKKEAASGETTG
jgi:hypothetical protein